MKQILKYALTLDSSQTLFVPYDFQIRHFGRDPRGELSMWAEVRRGETDKPRTRDITVGVFGTGHEIPVYWGHISTFVDEGFVWHLYLQPF